MMLVAWHFTTLYALITAIYSPPLRLHDFCHQRRTPFEVTGFVDRYTPVLAQVFPTLMESVK